MNLILLGYMFEALGCPTGRSSEQQDCAGKVRDDMGCCAIVVPKIDRKIPMVDFPSGTFLMGSEHGDPDEYPVHEVTISQGFSMMKT